MKNVKNLIFLFFPLNILLINSCITKKDISSFNFAENNSTFNIKDSIQPYHIKPKDKIQILISNVDEQTKNNINTINGNGIYTVTENGVMIFPQVGEIKVTDKTIIELNEELTKLYITLKLAKEPIFFMKFINFHITVLGEVNKPGIINLENNIISLPEALAIAGDLTNYSNRKNLLIIRENNGKREFLRFDINDKNVMNKEYYYLKNNDILYAEPNHVKAFASSQSRTILGFATGLITLYIILIGLK